MSAFTTIGALAGGIPRKYGNRLDLSNIADGADAIVALVESIRELTETFEFEELKYVTPQPPLSPLSLIAGQPIVTIASLLATIPTQSASYPLFQNQNFLDITDVYTFWMWFQGGVNQAGRSLKYRRVTTVDNDSFGITSNTQGQVGVAPPVYYTRFGNILQVGPAPDNNYQFFVRVKLRHPFPFTPPFIPASFTLTINSTGNVSGVNITGAGSGYPASVSTIPLAFNLPVGGVAATGTATSNASGQITSTAILTAGSGYVAGSPNAAVYTALVASQLVFIPDSWNEIMQISACKRIATWSSSQEQIVYYDTLLKQKGVDVEKAMAIKAQMQRDERHNERQVSMRLAQPYTFARR